MDKIHGKAHREKQWRWPRSANFAEICLRVKLETDFLTLVFFISNVNFIGYN